MLFSDFIKDSLLGKNNIAWNYYHHANINTDNILHADTSAEFIRKYFENGEKELPLLLNPEYAAAFLKDYFLAARKERVLFFEFDRQYALPPERAIHTVSGFFLGLLIENCLNAENSLSIENPGYFPFSYDFRFARKDLRANVREYLLAYMTAHPGCTEQEYRAECRRVFGWILQ